MESKSVDERLEELIWYYDSEDSQPNTIIRLADKVIELEEECEAFWRRGWAHAELENWEESMNDMKKAIEYGCAKDHWTWYNYGRAMFQIDGLERQSLGPITKSINLAYEEDLGNEDKGMAYELRGIVSVWLGDQADGCRDLQKAASLGRQNATNIFKKECGRISSIPSRDECINAADYKGCMEYHSGPSTESGSEPGTVNVAQPDPYNYDPDSVMQLKIRGSYGRYLTFIGKTVNTYTGTSGYMTPGSPGSVRCTTSPGFGAYSSSYTTCSRSGYVAPTYVPGTPGGVQNRKYRYELDCQDMTFDRKGDYAGGVVNKGWMSVDNDPTAQAVANKYCSRIHSLPRAVSR